MIFDKYAITFHTLDILIVYVRMAQGLFADYFSRKSPSPSTVSNVKHRIEKILHSGFKFIFYFISLIFFLLSKL